MATEAFHLRLSGRVQGVWFRAWTKNEADQLGLAGWVRNCPDGSVEAHVEGEAGAVETFIGRVGQGPPAARVAEVKVTPAPTEGLEGFEVRRDAR